MERDRGVLSTMTLGSGLKELQNGLAHGLRMVPGAGELWMYSAEGVLRLRGDELTRLARVRSASALGLGKAMAEGRPETLFLAGDIDGTKGMYRSTDEGATWVRIDDREHQYGWISPISGDARVSGRVYLGTNGFGVIVGEMQ